MPKHPIAPTIAVSRPRPSTHTTQTIAPTSANTPARPNDANGFGKPSSTRGSVAPTSTTASSVSGTV